MECWVSLSALAEATRGIRLGSLVTNVQYRNPALLAKMAATIDNISSGRLEFGIGAGGTGRSGWSRRLGFRAEYDAYGIDFPEATAVRIERLREAVKIIRRLWTDPKVSFSGQHYRIEDAFSYPKPMQKPHPPVWIGGSGEKFLLKVTAEEGDGCNFAWDLSPDDYLRRLRVLDEYCNHFGKSSTSLRKSLLTACVASADANEVKRALRETAERYNNIQDYVPYTRRSSSLTGTIGECIQKISEFRDVGVTDFILVFPETETHRWIVQFAEEVMPSF
jgi:alkanesulfonate monooxygenase SsuD/methylene tetrahydromethanopterin reductase-like flavin-dependent oxidoreductase (luciferase family)